MGKLLRPRDILLLGLSGTLDLFEEVKDPLYLVSKSYENMYGWTPKKFKRNHFYHLTWRSIRTGYIEKVEKDGETYLRLTSQGHKKFTRDFPLLTLQRKPWDKKWRFVIFDIEETQKGIRDRLRRKLRELGFGMLQESVFITPHNIAEDMAEFIEHVGLGESAYLFEVENILVGDKKELARKVWKLDEINDQYRELIEKIETEYLNYQSGRVKKLNRSTVEDLHREYIGILMSDPFLPKELLPNDWQADIAKAHLKRLRV